MKIINVERNNGTTSRTTTQSDISLLHNPVLFKSLVYNRQTWQAQKADSEREQESCVLYTVCKPA